MFGSTGYWVYSKADWWARARTNANHAGSASNMCSRLTACSHIHGLCASSCWSGCLGTCWCWQTFTLFSAAPAAWIHPYYLGSASGAAATTDSQSLLSAYGLGSREGAWNLLGVGIFISYNLHKQETVSVFVYLFALFVFSFTYILLSDCDAEQPVPVFPFPSQLFVLCWFQMILISSLLS